MKNGSGTGGETGNGVQPASVMPDATKKPNELPDLDPSSQLEVDSNNRVPVEMSFHELHDDAKNIAERSGSAKGQKLKGSGPRRLWTFPNEFESKINAWLDLLNARVLAGAAFLVLAINGVFLYFWKSLPEKGPGSLFSLLSIGMALFFLLVGMIPKFNGRIWALLGALAAFILWFCSTFLD